METQQVPAADLTFPAQAQAAQVAEANGATVEPIVPKANSQHEPVTPDATAAQLVQPQPAGQQPTPPLPAQAPTAKAPDTLDEALAQGGQVVQQQAPDDLDAALAQGGQVLNPQEDPKKIPRIDLAGGLKPDAIDDFLHKNLGMAQREWATKNVTNEDGTVKQVHEAGNFIEALSAGLQMSSLGRGLRSESPDVVLGENPSMAFKIAQGTGTVLGDLPVMMETGGLAGAAGVTSKAAKLGLEFAVPAAIRKMYADHDQKGNIQSASDFAARLMSTSWEAIKGGVTGAATAIAGPAGGVLATKLAPDFMKPVAGAAGSFLSELATMTTVGAALEGKLPEPEDFVTGGITMGMMHGVGLVGDHEAIASKMRNIFANTGEAPADILKAVDTNPILEQEIKSLNPELPVQATPTDLQHVTPEVPPPKEGEKPPEPEPGKWQLVPKSELSTNVEPEVRKVTPDESLTPEEQYFTDKIGNKEDAVKPASSLADKYMEIVATNLDRTKALRWLYDKAGVSAKPDDAAFLLQKMGASQAKFDSWINNSTYDFETKQPNGEPYKAIVDDYQKQFPEDPEMKKMQAFGMALRTIELNGRGIPVKVNGETLDLETAKRVVQNAPRPLAELFKRDVDFGNRGLEYLHDSGYFTEDQYNAMIDMNKAHISFSRVMPEDQFTGITPGSKGVKKIIGDGGLIRNPIMSRLENTEMMIRLAEQNRVKTKLVNDLWNTAAPTEGVIQSSQIPEEPDGPQTILSANHKGALKSNEFAVYENGERKIFATHEIAAQAINSMQDNPTGMFLGGQTLRALKNVYTAMTVGNPFFAAKHMEKNIWTSTLMNDQGAKIIMDTAKYLPEYITRGADYQQAKYEGAFVDNFLPPNEDPVLKQVMGLNNQAPFLDRAWNLIKKPLDLSHNMISNNDNSLRFGKYQADVERGFTPEEAASNARNIIPDYQLRGIKQNLVLQLAAFSRIHYGAEVQTIGAFKDNPVGVGMRGLMYVSLPAVAAWMWNKSNDDVAQSQKAFNQDNYMLIRGVGDWNPTNANRYNSVRDFDPRLTKTDGKGNFLVNDAPTYRIQYPFTIGTAFGGGVTAVMNSLDKKDPAYMGRWLKDVAGGTVASLIPTAFVPPIEQMTNMDLGSGRPLVSAIAEKGLPELEQKPYTSETAKQLSKVLHALGGSKIGPDTRTMDNPIVIDNYINKWTGTLGQAAVSIVDKALHSSGVGDTSEQPTKSWAENPFTRAFLVRNPSYSTQDVDDLFEVAKKEEEMQSSISTAMKTGNQANLDYIMKEYKNMNFGAIGPAKAMTIQMSIINKIKEAPGATALDKTQVIENLMWGVMATAKRGMEINKQLSAQQPSPTGGQ